MNYVEEVILPTIPFERYRSALGDQEFGVFEGEVTDFVGHLKKRTVWHINSTATGGGVAEMLQTILGYTKDLNINWRWLVISGNAPFFEITKRIHNGLHGSPGDGGNLGLEEAKQYEQVMGPNLEDLRKLINAGDYVILHDPQTAGLVSGLRKIGANVVWRCHIGSENHKNRYIRQAWDFLRPYLQQAQAFVFTREGFIPEWVPEDKRNIIPPSIDAFSAKNQDLEPKVCEAILAHMGLIAPPSGKKVAMNYVQRDGQVGTVKRFADVVHAGPLPAKDVPMVAQISRWDRLKDMAGVMHGFVEYVIPRTNAQLLLVGPNVQGVTDDPEGAEIYQECVSIWAALGSEMRSRIQLVCLPMKNVDENAAIVNAIQRHSQVVIQKSLYEGFGLTVTEALWKHKPVIATAVGGIQDQITNGFNGFLIDDPTDLKAMGDYVVDILQDKSLAIELGKQAHRRVKQEFLIPRHVRQYMDILRTLCDEEVLLSA